MATKWIRRRSDWPTQETYLNGNLIHSGKVECVDWCYADAIFKRKRPVPLTDTPFKVLEWRQNPHMYSTGNPSKGAYRVGTVVYVFQTTPIQLHTGNIDGKFMLNKARHKISGANQDLGETLAELDQTIDLIKKQFERIGKIGEALRDGKWSKLDSLLGGKTPDSVKKMKPSKRLASGYLEVMFGIMPLISSANTAVEAYGSGILSRGSKVSAVSGQKRVGLEQSVRNHKDNLGRASISGTVKNPNIATLNSYGLLNPALMAYQRLPYSFILDWFLPIGTILGSLTAEAGLQDVRQTYTDIAYSERDNVHGWLDRTVTYYRVVVDPGGLPPLGNPFGRAAQLSIGKFISSLALVRQRFP